MTGWIFQARFQAAGLDLDTLVLGGKEKPKSAGQAITKLTNKLLKESRAIQRGRLELQVQKAMIAGEGGQ